jgi:hypothetical protein
MRAKWSVALTALAMVGVCGPTMAQAEPGRYGGGFIEFLMTGDAQGPARRSAVDGYGALAAP